MVNDLLDINEFQKNNIKQVDKNKIFAESDFISIHTPLTKETINLIDLDVFKKMKNTAFLINTARGGIVNEYDLKYALSNGIIAGAALDVYEIEPPKDTELLKLPNLICTPHTGGNANEAVLAMGMSAIEHLIQYFKKKNNI